MDANDDNNISIYSTVDGIVIVINDLHSIKVSCLILAKVMFETKIYHPNIDESGVISLRNFIDWNPTYTLKHVMEEIRNSLEHPNAELAIVTSIASQYINDHAAFERTAREWTRLYAV